MGEPARATLYDQRMLPQRTLTLGFSFAFPRLDAAVDDAIAYRTRQCDDRREPLRCVREAWSLYAGSAPGPQMVMAP